jgi:serine/threonine protein kinase
LAAINVSKPAANIIRGFLCRHPSRRLGSLAGGEDDIYRHPWFSKIDFQALRRKEIKPPQVPKIKDPLDASNFEDWSHLDDKMKTKYPKLTREQAMIFDDF